MLSVFKRQIHQFTRREMDDHDNSFFFAYILLLPLFPILSS